VNIPRDETDIGLVRDTKVIVDETLEKLKNLEVRPPPPPAGIPQYFFVVSRRTRYIVDLPLAESPSVDLDGILLSIYEFMKEQSALEDGNVYLTKLGADSILVETFGGSLFAEAFSRDIERHHYKAFHRAVRHIQGTFPKIGSWDGTAQAVPPGLQDALRRHFGIDAGEEEVAAPAAAGPDRPAEPPPPAPRSYEPDIQDCERKMKEWYRKGYKIDRLKDALHSDWRTIVDTFDQYEKDIARLDRLRERARQLEQPGLEEGLRKIKPLLNDPSRVDEVEEAIRTLARKAKDSMMVRLPVSEPDALARAIKDLPLGIPSSLWGISLDKLVDELLSAERGLAPDGSVLVMLRSVWYRADARSKAFMTPFSGPVRTQKELLESEGKAVLMDKLVDDILNTGK
jgi:hypothetical protein